MLEFIMTAMFGAISFARFFKRKAGKSSGPVAVSTFKLDNIRSTLWLERLSILKQSLESQDCGTWSTVGDEACTVVAKKLFILTGSTRFGGSFLIVKVTSRMYFQALFVSFSFNICSPLTFCNLRILLFTLRRAIRSSSFNLLLFGSFWTSLASHFL